MKTKKKKAVKNIKVAQNIIKAKVRKAQKVKYSKVGKKVVENAIKSASSAFVTDDGQEVVMAGWDWVPEPVRLRIERFVPEYLRDFNATAACARCGLVGSANKGAELVKHPYAQHYIALKMREYEKEAIATQNEVLFGLKREAHAKDSLCANSASRIAAWKTIAQLIGMEKIQVQSEVSLNGGVMAVPLVTSPEEWENAARASQAALKGGAGE